MDEFEAERAWAKKQFLTELRDEFAMSAIAGILAGKWGQMASFPNAEHDDLVDSSVQALIRFRQGGFCG